MEGEVEGAEEMNLLEAEVEMVVDSSPGLILALTGNLRFLKVKVYFFFIFLLTLNIKATIVYNYNLLL